MATSPDPSSHWRYPGPSTRYHRSQVSQTAHHTRVKSEYKSIAPVLSTELRAHHRAQSSTTLPPSTPTAWRGSRPMSSSSSSIPSPSLMTTQMAHHHHHNITPEKPRRRSSDLRDSPFSDSCYFTEDDRSDLMLADGSRRNPSPPSIPSATQSLIIRLSKLQAQLLRQDPPHLFDIVARKLDEIEAESASPVASNISLMDSGLFLEEEDVVGTSTPQRQPPVAVIVPESPDMSTVIEVQETLTVDVEEAGSDLSLREAQEVLENVNKVQTELRQQLEELRTLRAELDLPEDDELCLKAATHLHVDELPEPTSALQVEDFEVQIDTDDGIIPFPPFEDITILETDFGDEPIPDVKSAWKELWDGLTAFAGMSNDEDLDGDIDT